MSYSPTVGRWTSEDPAGYVDGANLYETERSNTVNRLDPTGLETLDADLNAWSRWATIASTIETAETTGTVNTGMFQVGNMPTSMVPEGCKITLGDEKIDRHFVASGYTHTFWLTSGATDRTTNLVSRPPGYPSDPGYEDEFRTAMMSTVTYLDETEIIEHIQTATINCPCEKDRFTGRPVDDREIEWVSKVEFKSKGRTTTKVSTWTEVRHRMTKGAR